MYNIFSSNFTKTRSKFRIRHTVNSLKSDRSENFGGCRAAVGDRKEIVPVVRI